MPEPPQFLRQNFPRDAVSQYEHDAQGMPVCQTRSSTLGLCLRARDERLYELP